jgi:hypothetical protein
MPKENENKSTVVHIAVRYAECFSRPARVHPSGCGCDESTCEYSRGRDSFELKVLWQIPDSHINAAKDDKAWCDDLQNTHKGQISRLHTFPVPPCPECVVEPWVILASVAFPAAQQPSNGVMRISYEFRRTLLATQRLQTAMTCMP